MRDASRISCAPRANDQRRTARMMSERPARVVNER
jgi:hypothetical protein